MTTPSAAVARFSGLPSARALMASFTFARGGGIFMSWAGPLVGWIAVTSKGKAQDYFAGGAL